MDNQFLRITATETSEQMDNKKVTSFSQQKNVTKDLSDQSGNTTGTLVHLSILDVIKLRRWRYLLLRLSLVTLISIREASAAVAESISLMKN